MNNQAELDRSFDALSHPVRRAIVERLVAGPATVGKASAGLGISKPAVTKHLKVLEVAGVVSRSWLDLHRSLWEAKFEAVERHLVETHEGQEVPE
ncbi:MAG: transcriptional regulator, ArsR family [Thermoleophilia bacterium]|nr:transcriptional regulator, ArsR family [Thermoleophilia bacterium]